MNLDQPMPIWRCAACGLLVTYDPLEYPDPAEIQCPACEA